MRKKCTKCGRGFYDEGILVQCPRCRDQQNDYQKKYREKMKDNIDYIMKRREAVKKSMAKKRANLKEIKRVFDLERRKNLKPVPKCKPVDHHEEAVRQSFWKKGEVHVKPKIIIVDAIPGHEGLTKC